MKKTSQVLLATVSLLAAGLAQAGPPVEVTIKNLGAQQATLKLVTSNETSTYQIANPQPSRTIQASSSTVMRVQRVVSPDVNAAMVRYSIGGKLAPLAPHSNCAHFRVESSSPSGPRRPHRVAAQLARRLSPVRPLITHGKLSSL